MFSNGVTASVNAHQTVPIKAMDYFGAGKVKLTDLKDLEIYADHSGHAGDAFEGLEFKVEGKFYPVKYTQLLLIHCH